MIKYIQIPVLIFLKASMASSKKEDIKTICFLVPQGS
jgi:hypothetical protein